MTVTQMAKTLSASPLVMSCNEQVLAATAHRLWIPNGRIDSPRAQGYWATAGLLAQPVPSSSDLASEQFWRAVEFLADNSLLPAV
ncbi:MAG: hypothetical protein ACLQU1_11700 [Bryobacteraceae bacterium]